MSNLAPLTVAELDLIETDGPEKWLADRHAIRMRNRAARCIAWLIALQQHPSTEPEAFDLMAKHEDRLVAQFGRPKQGWLDRRVAIEAEKYAKRLAEEPAP